MKYLFINSLAGTGSTGRIVADKCRELMAQGHECLIAYGREEKNCQDIPTLRIGSVWDVRAHALASRILDTSGFGSYAVTQRLLRKIREYDPDVIWLHNIHGYYLHVGLLFAYLKTCGKPIYWTLHDCWSFTGHCAYFDFAGCDRWKTGCHNCPEKKVYPASILLDGSRRNFRRKKELFTGVPNLTLITPSQWLADLLEESYLKEYPVQVVHNTINTDIFRPTSGNFREKWGLEGKIMLLGVASVWDGRKGLQDYITLSQMLDDRFRFVLVGLKPEQAAALPQGFIAIPRTNSPEELAQIYSAADYFLNLTYEDNYPTVNLEAAACGTTIISYDTGGSRETLRQGDILVPKGDLDAVAAVLNK